MDKLRSLLKVTTQLAQSPAIEVRNNVGFLQSFTSGLTSMKILHGLLQRLEHQKARTKIPG